MDLCLKLFFTSVFLRMTSAINLLDTPILLDYTQMLSVDPSGLWDISHSFPTFETPEQMKFAHQVTLSEYGDVKLAWNFSEGNITFKLSARTTGWIGVGIARTRVGGGGSDFVVMGYRSDDSYLMDMHIDNNGDYVVDKEQDVLQDYIWETQDETFAIFTRPLVTCDHDQDVDITSDTLRIIWAFGASDIQKYSPMKDELIDVQKGSMTMKLLNPSAPTLQINTSDTDMTILDVTSQNMRLDQGVYHHCTRFKFPDLTSKSHIIQFEPIISPGNEYNVRQIAVLQCTSSDQEEQSGNCDEFHDYESKCSTVVLRWGIGMQSFAFPDDAGFPVEPDMHFILETSYVNPHGAGLVDSSGLKIFYTSVLRPHDAGVLTTGSLVHESQIIPPRSPEFLVQGHCMKECIQMALPQEGQVTIFAALLHSRKTGRKIRVRHFREGEELSPVAEDNQFDSLHQETQFLNHQVQLKKGDNMIVECTFDTLDRNEITYVNNSKGGESCLAYLSYYPRIAKLTACETAPTEKVIMDTVGALGREEVKKNAEEFSWTSEETREYNDQVLASQVYVHCGDVKFDEPKPVPKIHKTYKKQHKCRPRATAVYFQEQTTQTTEKDDGGNGSSSLFSSKIAILSRTILILCFYYGFLSS